jgi:2-polyprenyl-3-methyl-5-hydroxy-6-metoxy-1,4-benzoquinol methylase
MSEQYQCKLCDSKESMVLVSGMRDWEYGAPGEYSYRQCCACDQIQIHPFPSLNEIMEAYPDAYPAYIGDIKNNRGRFYNLLLTLHDRMRTRHLPKVQSHAKILDIGSGNGDFLCQLKKQGIYDLHGIDFNKHSIAIMEKKGIKAFHGMYLDYPAERESFDLISMNHYIEHVLDPIAELKKSFDLLKSGGILFGILPNFNGLDRSLFKKFWGGNHVPRHTFQYTDKQLNKLLKNTGFTDIKIKHDINTGAFAISIQNWLQRHASDLKNNPKIKHGRMKNFNLLLMLCLPPNILFAWLRRSGIIGFYSVKP